MHATKMPPMSLNNKLELEDQDQDLKLTELEWSMITKNIILKNYINHQNQDGLHWHIEL